jgi:hypothetical protein
MAQYGQAPYFVDYSSADVLAGSSGGRSGRDGNAIIYMVEDIEGDTSSSGFAGKRFCAGCKN